MSNDAPDPQDQAEAFDEDLVAGGAGLSDEVPVSFPPDRLHGVPFADSDVTDESLEDRLAQEEPDVVPDDDELEIIADELVDDLVDERLLEAEAAAEEAAGTDEL
jgi:hypothetical protein